MGSNLCVKINGTIGTFLMLDAWGKLGSGMLKPLTTRLVNLTHAHPKKTKMDDDDGGESGESGESGGGETSDEDCKVRVIKPDPKRLIFNLFNARVNKQLPWVDMPIDQVIKASIGIVPTDDQLIFREKQMWKRTKISMHVSTCPQFSRDDDPPRVRCICGQKNLKTLWLFRRTGDDDDATPELWLGNDCTESVGLDTQFWCAKCFRSRPCTRGSKAFTGAIHSIRQSVPFAARLFGEEGTLRLDFFGECCIKEKAYQIISDVHAYINGRASIQDEWLRDYPPRPPGMMMAVAIASKPRCVSCKTDIDTIKYAHRCRECNEAVPKRKCTSCKQFKINPNTEYTVCFDCFQRQPQQPPLKRRRYSSWLGPTTGTY